MDRCKDLTRVVRILGSKQLTSTEAENKYSGEWVTHRICKKNSRQETREARRLKCQCFGTARALLFSSPPLLTAPRTTTEQFRCHSKIFVLGRCLLGLALTSWHILVSREWREGILSPGFCRGRQELSPTYFAISPKKKDI